MTCQSRIILPVNQIPPPLTIPPQQVPPDATIVAKEEIGSLCLSLEKEINQFRFEKEEKAPKKPVELSNSKTESDRLSFARLPKLVVTRIDSSSKEMEMRDLKKRSSPRGLIANKNKGGTSKDVSKTQTPAILPPPHPPPTNLGLLANPNLKKKRPGQELEEGEVAPQKGSKQQKTTKDLRDKKATSVDSRDEAKVHRQQRT